MSSFFKVSFLIPAKKLNVLVGLIEKEVTELSIMQVKGPRTVNRPSPVKSSSKKQSGTGLPALLKEFCSTRDSGSVFRTDKNGPLGNFLHGNGYSKTTCSPAATLLVRMNLAKRTSKRGVCQIL